MKRFPITLLFTVATLCATAQNTPLLQQYRRMALDYNHNLRAAQKNIEASMELVKSAQADLKPKLSAGADFQYTGQPIQLTTPFTGADGQPIGFEGRNLKYGASATLMQPLYTGGRLLESIRIARHSQSLATHEADLLHSAVCYQTDMQYWNTVARAELLTVATDYRNSINRLAQTIDQRVQAGFTDPQDLLMVQVKLNEADYRLLQAQSNFETGLMALNSLVGIPLTDETQVDTEIQTLTSIAALPTDSAHTRPELLMAQDRIRLAQSTVKLTDAQFKPQLHLGVDGSYSSPGYDFRTDMDPNYAIYAKLSVPLFEWGKRRNEKRAARQQVEIAQHQLMSTTDDILLETATACTALEQAIEQVSLTKSSLHKAQQNERMAQERYDEGKVSVVEVIEATNYRQTSQVNFVEAKAQAQAQYAALLKATNAYAEVSKK